MRLNEAADYDIAFLIRWALGLCVYIVAMYLISRCFSIRYPVEITMVVWFFIRLIIKIQDEVE